ncbi:MAG: DUF89 family protein [Clostridia bacterium]|nr:DUF89 family protein [Clostridia bacterium]
MQYSSQCIPCLIKRQIAEIEKYPDERARLGYMKEICAIIAASPDGVAAPWLVSRFNRVRGKYFDEADIYASIKKQSNDYITERLDRVRAAIERADDPLLCALKYARAGNYIDFGALHGSVDMQQLESKLDAAPDEWVDPAEYTDLLRDLESAKNVLYILDNAGEIVLDMVFIGQLKKRFPQARITAAVRGAPVINDATREDAQYVGLDKIVPVIDNGCDISGTQISECGESMQKALRLADVIIAKGQGNFETMLGCGLNVYYLFLCKCDLFVKAFSLPRLTGVLLNERRCSVRWTDL